MNPSPSITGDDWIEALTLTDHALVILPSSFNVTFKTLKLSEVYSEIFDNDPTLNQLYNNDNSVKSQMDNAFVPLYIYSENNGIISASNNENNRKNRHFFWNN